MLFIPLLRGKASGAALRLDPGKVSEYFHNYLCITRDLTSWTEKLYSRLWVENSNYANFFSNYVNFKKMFFFKHFVSLSSTDFPSVDSQTFF